MSFAMHQAHGGDAGTEREAFGEPSLAYYYREVERHPLLTPDEERALTEQIAQGDQPWASARARRDGDSAREKLITSNLRFVIYVAKSYKNQGLSMADLINEGNVGLTIAARKFKPEKGNKFITYAVWWIRQNILKALETQTRAIRVPGNVLNDLNKLRKVEADLYQHLARHPDAEEIACEADQSLDKVNHTFESTCNAVSLDTPMYDDTAITLQEILPDPQALPPEDAYIRDAMHRDVQRALSALSDRARQVLHLYYGFDTEGDDASVSGGVDRTTPATYQQIGDKLGLSRERVRQLKEEALTRLRHPAHTKRLAAYCS